MKLIVTEIFKNFKLFSKFNEVQTYSLITIC